MKKIVIIMLQFKNITVLNFNNIIYSLGELASIKRCEYLIDAFLCPVLANF